MNVPILTFTSDFGHEDWFVGVVHGAIHAVCPTARIADLTHEIPPGRVERAAFVIEAAAPDFPVGTIHLAVVDPGVGTERRGLVVRAHRQLFVGPDNGLLDYALADPDAEIRSLTQRKYFRMPVSRTFHGRDVFGPVAGHLAAGVRLDEFGPLITDPVRLKRPRPEAAHGMIEGSIVRIDRFGNALTNLTAEAITAAFPGVSENQLEVRVFAKSVRGISRSYGDAPIGTLVALLGSSGRLELAEVGGHAASRWGLGEDDAVQVVRAS